jgi:hypothetical protein
MPIGQAPLISWKSGLTKVLNDSTQLVGRHLSGPLACFIYLLVPDVASIVWSFCRGDAFFASCSVNCLPEVQKLQPAGGARIMPTGGDLFSYQIRDRRRWRSHMLGSRARHHFGFRNLFPGGDSCQPRATPGRYGDCLAFPQWCAPKNISGRGESTHRARRRGDERALQSVLPSGL